LGPSEIGQLITVIILLCLSAFFSSSETALTTVNQIRMRTLADNGDKRAARVLRVTGNPGKMLSAILIGNNIVNLSASSISTSLAIHLFGNTGAGIATGILTFLILIFGEVTPKTMATIKADSMSLTVAAPIGFLMKILTPVIFIINKLSLGLMFLLHINIKDAQKKMTEEELRTIVDVSQENGVIEHEERDMIHNLFDFGDAEAKEIMVPRIDMTFVQADATYQEVLDIFRQDMFTRLPVYEDSTDNVIGIINMKDFLLQNDTPEFSVRNLLREPYFTYEHKNTADLFLEMRKSSISLAIVLDEYGVTAGLITLEDLLEEIVGEIRDEYDADEEDDITRISDREFYVLGSANLNDVSEALSLHFTSDDYDTIGGYCLGLLDHLPEKNEIILTDNNILIRIDRMEKNRIERIYIRLPEPLEETSSEQKSEE
jgi:putative hemolysin